MPLDQRTFKRLIELVFHLRYILLKLTVKERQFEEPNSFKRKICYVIDQKKKPPHFCRMSF